MVTRALVLSSLAMLCACTTDRTEIIVAVDTTLRVPDDIDGIRIDVIGPDETTTKGATAVLGPGEPPLPRTLGLVHDDGPLGPVVIRVAGRRGGGDVVERRARTSFVEGKTLLLRMDLFASCVGTTCDPNSSCGAGGCAPIDVDPASLPEWTGSAPRVDGSVPAVDAGVDDSGPRPDACRRTGPEECNGRDDDCDGSVDEDFDLMVDPLNCGGCGTRCMAPDRACCAGECGRC